MRSVGVYEVSWEHVQTEQLRPQALNTHVKKRDGGLNRLKGVWGHVIIVYCIPILGPYADTSTS